MFRGHIGRAFGAGGIAVLTTGPIHILELPGCCSHCLVNSRFNRVG
jgi:hypothetical protein